MYMLNVYDCQVPIRWSDSRSCDIRDALRLLSAGKINVDTIVTHELPLDRPLA
jgi:threonine dehydrogenase-like Zn-dependent dehydrogenase